MKRGPDHLGRSNTVHSHVPAPTILRANEATGIRAMDHKLGPNEGFDQLLRSMHGNGQFRERYVDMDRDRPTNDIRLLSYASMHDQGLKRNNLKIAACRQTSFYALFAFE